MPDLHPHGNRMADEHFAHIARRADALIAVSDCTRADAVRVLKLDPAKVTVIHSGVADSFFDPPAAAVESVRRRYSLARPFVLFTGTIEPRKNLETLFDAFESLSASTRAEFDLVIAGPLGWAPDSTRARLARFRYLGYVPEPDLAPLTAAATVFAYPSLYEGFGFPVAQAMAASVPVITSNVSSLPEVAGDAALLVDPRSVDGLRAALERLLTSSELRARLSTLARRRANAFRWSACADKSLVFFRKVL
jgi:glycosyltransferase involved in cell wall biosynthesis